MLLWTFFWGILLTLAVSFPGLSRDPILRRASGANLTPVWRVDLHSLGYGGYKMPHEFPSRSVLEPLGFLSNKVLITSFLAREAVTELPRRGQAEANLPVKLHALFFGAATGDILPAKQWSVPDPNSVDIVPTREGRFILIMRNRLTLYSQDLQPLRELTLFSPPGPSGDILVIRRSPEGGSLLVVYLRGDKRINWIEASDLKVLGSWSGPLTPATVSDGDLAQMQERYVKPGDFTTHEVSIRGVDGPWRTVCRVRLGLDPENACGSPEFISNDVLALLMSHSLTLIPAVGGHVLLREKFREDEWVGRPHSSADGNRLAVPVVSHKGGSALFDTNFHSVLKRIMVFDLQSRQWIYTLDAKRQKIKTLSGLALSPDGSLMAILSEGVVQVYRLPPEKKEQ